THPVTVGGGRGNCRQLHVGPLAAEKDDTLRRNTRANELLDRMFGRFAPSENTENCLHVFPPRSATLGCSILGRRAWNPLQIARKGVQNSESRALGIGCLG